MLLDLVETFVIAAAVFLVIYLFLFRPFQVNGMSMYPTYNPGEFVLINIIALRISPIERGEVIVFKSPPDQKRDFIKRVIGLPGDTIRLRDGRVYVNEKLLNESYLPSDQMTYPAAFLKEEESIVVPVDSYFVMGDNRLRSSDSREWGFVPKSLIIGKAFFVYWPPNKLRLVKNK